MQMENNLTVTDVNDNNDDFMSDCASDGEEDEDSFQDFMDEVDEDAVTGDEDGLFNQTDKDEIDCVTDAVVHLC